MRRRVREAGRRTFRAISVRNYRLYFTGQVISVSGTWMQTVAQAYLILFPLHGTGVDVAIATSLQFLPLLLLGPFGGLIADRLDKRKVLYATQGTAGVLALALGLLVVTHSVTLWQVYVLAAGLGFVNLFDNPARQTFVSEMVGHELLPERGQPQQRADELGPGHRAGHRRGPDPHRGRGHLLLPERRVVRRGDRGAGHDACSRAVSATGRRARPRARCARGCATCGPRPT